MIRLTPIRYDSAGGPFVDVTVPSVFLMEKIRISSSMPQVAALLDVFFLRMPRYANGSTPPVRLTSEDVRQETQDPRFPAKAVIAHAVNLGYLERMDASHFRPGKRLDPEVLEGEFLRRARQGSSKRSSDELSIMAERPEKPRKTPRPPVSEQVASLWVELAAWLPRRSLSKLGRLIRHQKKTEPRFRTHHFVEINVDLRKGPHQRQISTWLLQQDRDQLIVALDEVQVEAGLPCLFFLLDRKREGGGEPIDSATPSETPEAAIRAHPNGSFRWLRIAA